MRIFKTLDLVPECVDLLSAVFLNVVQLRQLVDQLAVFEDRHEQLLRRKVIDPLALPRRLRVENFQITAVIDCLIIDTQIVGDGLAGIIAEEANEIKSRFLTTMSYNIRIPLNNVVGFSQLMTEDVYLSEDEKREYSGIIQSNSAELIRRVNDVLDLSSLEANMTKFQLQNCNVHEWCNELPCLVQMRSEGSIHLE